MQEEHLKSHPFFNLVSDVYQAELVLSVLTCFGDVKERRILKPQAFQIRRDYFGAKNNEALHTKVNRLLSSYLMHHGEFSDQLTIFLSRSVKYTESA